MNATQILNREFLDLRCRVLDLAAALDRLERAEGEVANDVRLKRLQAALQLLLEAPGNRAERVQLLFSREYTEHWPTELGVPVTR